jgi:addiction module HigA family antidote
MKRRKFLGTPVILVTPGEILRHELEARDLSQKRLAEMIGRPEQAVSEIIRAKKRITADTALDLSEALGIEAEFWLNLQVNFELDQARRRRPARLAKTGGRRTTNDVETLPLKRHRIRRTVTRRAPRLAR